MTISLTTLPNGIRVITDTVESVESVALGCYFGVGTRHENLADNGIAHLVEHMMFKGTATRTARDIVETIENVGGQMNAFTGRETTGYHMHLLKEHAPLALSVLADMLQHSVFDQGELERERQVILQEIGMATDTPDDLVFDRYQTVAWPAQGLGAPILGTAQIVATMPRTAIIDYTRNLYNTGTLVVSAAGNVRHDDMVAQVKDLFKNLPAGTPPARQKPTWGGGETRLQKDLEQAHIVLGFQGIPRLDEDYYAAVALSQILGGGMSSRLFQEVREKRGLVYSIYASHTAYADAGQFVVYAGTDPARLPELMPVLADELKKVISTVTEEEVTRVRAQLKANLLMGRESMGARADGQAKYLLFHGRAIDISDLTRRIDAVTVSGISKMAERIFSSRLVLSALGPLEKLVPYETMMA